MPFERVAQEIHAIFGLQVSASTIRRQTLQAGGIAQEIQTEQAQAQGSSRFAVVVEPPTERLAMGSDGGMVPLRGGQWAEVKTLVIGEVVPGSPSASGHASVRTRSHSYFSRLTDAQGFADMASAEIARRGVTQAPSVCAIQDGAEWLQGFVDGHRADAVRILDFAHAAEYLGQVAEQGRLAGYHVPLGWLPVILHQLKHHGPARIMTHLDWWQKHRPLPAVMDAIRYLGKRLAQMDYPQFQAQGWPIGSGMVESANKVVMQARLKGAGMHWKPTNVNPMLALRGDICNERWSESWHHQQRWRKDYRHAQRRQRSQEKRTRQAQELREQIVHICLRLPSSTFAPQPPFRKGRTEGQKRWGRQTFSHRRLQDGVAKK